MVGEDPLAGVSAVLVVVAHPDDESFGLGGIVDRLVRSGARASVLCFTHGEASTLHGVAGDLRAVRSAELDCAAGVLGVGRVDLLDYADGGLAAVPLAELAGHVTAAARRSGASHLLVFDDTGITGHPDHIQATRAAVAAAGHAGLPVLAWALHEDLARRLNDRLGTGYAGRPPEQLDHRVAVSRRRQARAIACHRSQATDNPALALRLALQGGTEFVRRLR